MRSHLMPLAVGDWHPGRLGLNGVDTEVDVQDQDPVHQLEGEVLTLGEREVIIYHIFIYQSIYLSLKGDVLAP